MVNRKRPKKKCRKCGAPRGKFTYLCAACAKPDIGPGVSLQQLSDAGAFDKLRGG